MGEFTTKELRRFEIAAWALLGVAAGLWVGGGAARAARVGIAEYLTCLMGVAGVLACTAMTVRVLVLIRGLIGPSGFRPGRDLYLFLFAFDAMAVGALVWLMIERERVPDLALLRPAAATAPAVLLTLILASVPWVVMLIGQVAGTDARRR